MLTSILDGLWCLLKSLNVLLLAILVVKSGTDLALSLEVLVLSLFTLLYSLGHSVLEVKLRNVDVRVTVDIDVRVKKHQFSDGLSILRDST
jgi:hypothetical protein